MGEAWIIIVGGACARIALSGILPRDKTTWARGTHHALFCSRDADDRNYRKEIPSMPGQYQLSLAQLEKWLPKTLKTD